MEYIQLTKLVQDGEYEAILREMEISPYRFEKCQGGWQKYGDQPVCRVNLYFEILDGSPGAANPDDWLWYDEYWPDRDSALDRIVKMVEGLGIPHIEKPFPRITSLPLGHRFRVQVVNTVQVGGGRALHYSFVTEVLGLAEPALAR
jgi:hypothetical protein